MTNTWLIRMTWILVALLAVVLVLRAHGTPQTWEYIVTAVVLFGVSLVSAMHVLGYRAALTFAFVAIACGWTAEQIGTTTGLLFGSYVYAADVLGPAIGEVPVIVPLMWFALVYIAYVMASLTIWQRAIDEQTHPLPIMWTCLFTALLVSGYNMGADPYNQSVVHAYSAKDPGPYFGVPFSAYVGWTATAFTIALAYRIAAGLMGFRAPPAVRAREALVPIALYVGFMMFYVLEGYPEPVKLIVIFTMGTPSVAALAGWYRWTRERSTGTRP